MANRALAAKAEKAKRQSLGIDRVAPRFTDKAGAFRATENTKSFYLLARKPAPANIEGCKVRVIPTGRHAGVASWR